MNVPKDVYGREFANHLIRRWAFHEVRQTGSHIILRTEQPHGFTVSVPAHKPLRVGTLRALLKDIAELKGVSPADVLGDL